MIFFVSNAMVATETALWKPEMELTVMAAAPILQPGPDTVSDSLLTVYSHISDSLLTVY